MSKIKAEYIWMDGHEPTQKLRSKTKVFDGPLNSINDLAIWGFDGSSTNQASGDDSDCMLKPVSYYPDPIRGGDDVLVMCEVMNADGSVHETNTRAHLEKLMKILKKKNLGLVLSKSIHFFKGECH